MVAVPAAPVPELSVKPAAQKREASEVSEAEMPKSPRPDIVEGLTRLLIEQQRMKRPPQQAARLLAYIIELHKRDLPFPPRKIVAELLGISIPTIDTVLSARLAEGYLTCEVRIIEGNAKNRSSSIKQRYYHPSQDLIEVFDQLYGA